MRRAALTALALCAASPALAGEGMWLPEQLPLVADDLESMGLELDAETLSDLSAWPLGAIVSLGGCSASFVSEDGLVITNHHCAVGALQMNSSAEANLVDIGFVADDRADEVWAGPGSRVLVTESLTDVTDTIRAAADAAADDYGRWEAIDRTRKQLVAECEADAGYRCTVAVYDSGGSYRLIRQLEIEDVRIVFAPPSMIGFYGGDEDNWMWPRHAGDFTLFRAYVGPDGVPAAHDEANVPYTPPHHLEIARDGVDDGDFVMVAGYPGRTNRYRTASEVAWAETSSYPWSIATMEDVMAILDARIAADETAAVTLGGLRFGIGNYLKNNRGMLDGFASSGLTERAQAREDELLDWLEGQDDPAAAADIRALREAIEARRATAERDRIVGWAMWTVRLLGAARTGVQLAKARAIDDDLLRDAGFQERDWDRITEGFGRISRSFDREADEQLLAYWLRRADDLGPDQRIEAFDNLLDAHRDADDPYTAAAAAAYDETRLTVEDERMALLEADVDDVEFARDPLVALAWALEPLREANQQADRAFSGLESRLRPVWLQALQDAAGRELYPDANGTLRITYGLVRGYPGDDGVWYLPQTTAAGIPAKHTDTDPFDAPDELLEAIDAGEWGPYVDGDLDALPIDFLTTLDSTGGNSGSATLNARGELVGLLFDGNYEAMASDWVFDPVRTRSIHVDIQYALWLMDRVYPAPNTLREMGIEPTFAD